MNVTFTAKAKGGYVFKTITDHDTGAVYNSKIKIQEAV